jgi:hypothetical protein
VTAQADIRLGQPEPAPLRDRDLLRHQVEPGDRLGHRVLYLDARVHLEEPERGPFGVHQEFDGAQALVLQVQAEGDRRRTDADPQRLAEPRCRRFLDELLIPSLHRAVPVAEVDHVLPVAQQLYLDVPRGGDVPLQVHPRIGEGRLRLGAGHRDRLGEPAGIADHPQPPPAAASRRLDQHRIPDPLCQPGRVRGVGQPSRIRRADQPARQHRESRRHRVIPRRELVPGRLEHVRARPDEHDARRLARPRKPRVLRQEAVAGVDRIRSGCVRGRDDRLHIEITLGRAHGPDPDCVVGQPGRYRVRVGVRDRQHGLDAEPLAGAQHADGDLAAIGDQHPPQDHGSALMRSSVAPCAANSAFCTQNSATVPATPACTEFISFMVSTIPITVSALTWLPTSTNGAAPGRGAR